MLVTRFFSPPERQQAIAPDELMVPHWDEQPTDAEWEALGRYIGAGRAIGSVPSDHRAGYTRFHATRLATFYYSAEVERVRFE